MSFPSLNKLRVIYEIIKDLINVHIAQDATTLYIVANIANMGSVNLSIAYCLGEPFATIALFPPIRRAPLPVGPF
jgi:hypothetical protein